MFYKPPKYLIHFFLLSHQAQIWIVSGHFWVNVRFYNIEEAVELLTNMTDCEDESTSESENEGDSSDSSEDAPEQHQVRTDSIFQCLKKQRYLKPKKYPKMTKKLHQNWLIIRVPQSMLYWLVKQSPHQVRNMLLHLQKYLNYLKPKKYPAKKLHQNWLIIRVPQSVLYWLIKQPPHQVRSMFLHLQKYLKYLKPKNTQPESCTKTGW